MSHGSTEKCEPNFVPLLDLVLQLVMFFMLVTHFVMEQTNESIKLPKALAAKFLDKGEENPIILNVNEDGKVLLSPDQKEGESGADALDNEIQVQNYMTRRAKLEMAASKKDHVDSTLILRIDKYCRFEKTYKIWKACRLAGYTKVQLRVMNTPEA